jgi:hypothetical protein
MKMTLLKAAEILDATRQTDELADIDDYYCALEYGTQALRSLDYHRKAGHIFAQDRLSCEIEVEE